MWTTHRNYKKNTFFRLDKAEISKWVESKVTISIFDTLYLEYTEKKVKLDQIKIQLEHIEFTVSSFLSSQKWMLF